MTTKEVFSPDKLLHLLLTIAIIAGGFVTYRVWPLRERVSLAEQDIRTICKNQQDIKTNQDKRYTKDELNPVLENIKKQLEIHQKSCESLNTQIHDLSVLMARIEAKME